MQECGLRVSGLKASGLGLQTVRLQSLQLKVWALGSGVCKVRVSVQDQVKSLNFRV